jgi:hypothetical protein
MCGENRNGKFQVVRKTIKRRMRIRLKEVRSELQQRMHHPVREQGKWLQSVVRGYFAYHAVPGNMSALDSFRTEVARHWLATLRRRSQRDRTNWKRMGLLAERWLPHPKILHPYPERRFDGIIQGKSPVR